MNHNATSFDLNPSSLGDKSATLDRAIRIIGRANVSPQSIGRKLRRSSVTLVIGAGLAIALFLVIRLDVFQGDAARAMSVFLLLASLAVVLMSSIAMSFMVWNAFVHQHVQLLEANAEVAEVTRQLQVVLNSMEKAVPQSTAEALTTAEQMSEGVAAQAIEQEVDVLLVEAAERASRVAEREVNELVDAMRRTITEGAHSQERVMSKTV
jgi:dynactin complex subunit